MTHATFATGMSSILDDFASHAEAREWLDNYRFLHGKCVGFVLERGGEDDFWQIVEVVK